MKNCTKGFVKLNSIRNYELQTNIHNRKKNSARMVLPFKVTCILDEVGASQ